MKNWFKNNWFKGGLLIILFGFLIVTLNYSYIKYKEYALSKNCSDVIYLRKVNENDSQKLLECLLKFPERKTLYESVLKAINKN